MTTEQLKYFISIAENNSYSTTAEEMNISQSSVSKQIRTFEWELGCTLFDRGNRQVRLTEAGARLYPLLKDMLTRFDAIMRESHGYKRSGNLIRLASLPIMGQYGVTEAIRLFETERRDIQIEIIEQEEREILETLAGGGCDLAVVREEILPPEMYKTIRLTTDRLALFVHENHPYADYRVVTMEMLRRETFMFMRKHTFIYKLCVRLCQKYGIQPNVVSCARIETILSNVASSRCSSLLMAKSIDSFKPVGIRVIPVEPPCISSIVMVLPSPEGGNEKKAVLDFTKFIARCFTGHEG